jgi:hypothetical protein
MQKMFVIHYRMLVTLVKMIYTVNSKIISMTTAAILKFLSLKRLLFIFVLNGRRCHKKREKFNVLGISWSLIEMLYGMWINGFEAWKFQNACSCHGNRKNTQFNTKMNNNLLRLRNFKMAAVAMEIIFEFTV